MSIDDARVYKMQENRVSGIQICIRLKSTTLGRGVASMANFPNKHIQPNAGARRPSGFVFIAWNFAALRMRVAQTYSD